MIFFPGLHQPSDAGHFERCMVSVNRLRGRVSDFAVEDWIMDSGAFTEVTRHGGFRYPPEEYAGQVDRWAACGNLLAAATQDYMCEPFALDATGLSLHAHQILTVERFDAIQSALTGPTYLLPVLQGYAPEEYVEHIAMYGARLKPGAWVGVGSVCKRNGTPGQVEAVLLAIMAARPDLRLHGFGLKITALASATVRRCLHSADSMAWSYHARKRGRNGNDWKEAMRYTRRVERQPSQEDLFFGQCYALPTPEEP